MSARIFCQCGSNDYQIVCMKCGEDKGQCPYWKCRRPLGQCGCMNKV